MQLILTVDEDICLNNHIFVDGTFDRETTIVDFGADPLDYRASTASLGKSAVYYNAPPLLVAGFRISAAKGGKVSAREQE